LATSTDLHCRFRLSIGGSFEVLFDDIKAPKYALVWFCFNDGYEMTWEVELPLKPLCYFNEQRPMGQTNKRGLYVAPRFEKVSTMFRLKAVGVNQTEFVYEESPQLPPRARWRMVKQKFKRRFAVIKKNVVRRYRKRAKVNKHFKRVFQ